MKTVVNTLEKSMKELKVTFEAAEWKEAQDKALDKLAATAQLDGFRKGNAPKALIKAKVGSKNIQNEAVDVLLQEKYNELIDGNNIAIVGQPQVKIDKINKDELEVTLVIPVAPEFELKQYKDLEVKKDDVTVTDEEVDNRIKGYQNDFAELVIKGEDAVAENGDTATIDFEGFKDGVPFEGGKGDNYPLELGSGSFIPGFEEQVVGMKVNEEKEINVTFPEDYQAEELAGQEVVFKVKVHEIKSKVLPEIDDELAKDVNLDGVDTLEDLKAHVRSELTSQKELAADNKFAEDVVTALVEANPFDVPEAMVDQEAQQIVSEISRNFEAQGFTLDMYKQMTGQTTEQIKESVMDQAEKRVKYQLILNEIVKAENIEVSDEELNKEYEDIAAQYGKKVEEVKDIFKAQEEMIISSIKQNKAGNLVRESVK